MHLPFKNLIEFLNISCYNQQYCEYVTRVPIIKKYICNIKRKKKDLFFHFIFYTFIFCFKCFFFFLLLLLWGHMLLYYWCWPAMRSHLLEWATPPSGNRAWMVSGNINTSSIVNDGGGASWWCWQLWCMVEVRHGGWRRRRLIGWGVSVGLD
jgi:hypothetical protein